MTDPTATLFFDFMVLTLPAFSMMSFGSSFIEDRRFESNFYFFVFWLIERALLILLASSCYWRSRIGDPPWTESPPFIDGSVDFISKTPSPRCWTIEGNCCVWILKSLLALLLCFRVGLFKLEVSSWYEGGGNLRTLICSLIHRGGFGGFGSPSSSHISVNYLPSTSISLAIFIH